MWIFSGGFGTETNTFAPMPTGMASFKERGYFAAGQHPDRMQQCSGPLWAARLQGAWLASGRRHGGRCPAIGNGRAPRLRGLA